MKAVLIEQFGLPPKISDVDDPVPVSHGVVVKVEATGVCRSDWHGWIGHDSDIELPHVPGHELAGTIVEVGQQVKNWRVGDRVTVPFVGGCGSCRQCYSGNQQICDHQFQPGFTHWGSFAQFVGLHYADLNLVALPEDMEFATAASLGCRFVTSFRAVVDQGKVSAGQWVAVHGCGGVGLSAIMIAQSLGANVIAIDISQDKLELAKKLGARYTVNANDSRRLIEEVIDLSNGGVHVSIDALGHTQTCRNSILNLRKRGKHIQVGLMAGDHSDPNLPMAKVIADELEIVGSHGMQAHRYDAMMAMIQSGQLKPELLVGETINLEQSIEALTYMDQFQAVGTTVVTEF